MNLPAMKYLIFTITALLGAELAAQTPSAIFANFNHLTYTGGWTRHANLTDAQNNANATDTGTVPLRDINFSYNSETNRLFFNTFWNATDSSGSGSPHNRREGFMQIYDETGSSITNVDYGYTGTNNETLNLTIEGANALGAEFGADNKPNGVNNQYCRAGVGTNNDPLSNNGDNGDWLDFTLDFDYTGTLSSDETFFSVNDVSGTLSVLFQHKDPRHAALNGFYRIDLNITDENSWAVANNSDDLKDNTGVTVPEPATYSILLGLVVLGVAIKSRKHHCPKI